MPKSKRVIIYLYNRLFDPLIQSNFWLYIRSYLDDLANPIQFHLITYEDPRFPLNEEQKSKVAQWQQQGLNWTPLTWHAGTGLANKFKDLFSGHFAVAKLRTKGYNHVVSLGSVAGTFAYVYAQTLGIRTFLYQYEPHSEYAIDNGMWAGDSLQYKLSHFLERRSAEYASVIASGTRFMQERLENDWKVKAKFFRIPTVANEDKFTFNPVDRAAVRQELGLKPDQWVLYYPGKFGDLYYREELAWMFKWLNEECPDLHLLIVTPHTDEEVHTLFAQAEVPQHTYSVCHSDYQDIHRYAFACDFAIISVPPGPSKCFISNIKVGEYLCAGLPFLITRGVSEDFEYAEQRGVGVVVDDFVKDEAKKAWPEIKAYLEMDAEQRRQHCREIGLGYRGFSTLNPIFKAAIDTLTRRNT
ncbi:MAG: hypothetical protein QJT81_09425 [Candidatus Thiothrix putei]|uniref:Glycosyltransferase n=1 Tax=Candidatus Thiothrix putei TaxID=3080811 RepID=A0AA95HF85_9GAMM|nr:MAG: hypothetical protein QJT81_09425 [Candidatus Thiothrix putei]